MSLNIPPPPIFHLANSYCIFSSWFVCYLLRDSFLELESVLSHRTCYFIDFVSLSSIRCLFYAKTISSVLMNPVSISFRALSLGLELAWWIMNYFIQHIKQLYWDIIGKRLHIFKCIVWQNLTYVYTHEVITTIKI